MRPLLPVLPKMRIYRVAPPCKPGFEGKWCLHSYWRHPDGSVCVSFYTFATRREAREAARR